MTITLSRDYPKADYTIGRLYIDGQFFCNTLEDTDRGLTNRMTEQQIRFVKIIARTAIPKGEYQIETTYSPKYKRKMPQLLHVKGFEGIRIHSGNTADDTEGCILLGKNTAKGRLTESRATVQEFERLLQKAGGKATITIV